MDKKWTLHSLVNTPSLGQANAPNDDSLGQLWDYLTAWTDEPWAVAAVAAGVGAIVGVVTAGAGAAPAAAAVTGAAGAGAGAGAGTAAATVQVAVQVIRHVAYYAPGASAAYKVAGELITKAK